MCDQDAASVTKAAEKCILLLGGMISDITDRKEAGPTCHTPALKSCSRRRSKRANLMSSLAGQYPKASFRFTLCFNHSLVQVSVTPRIAAKVKL